jgi:hypothetical protein
LVFIHIHQEAELYTLILGICVNIMMLGDCIYWVVLNVIMMLVDCIYWVVLNVIMMLGDCMYWVLLNVIMMLGDCIYWVVLNVLLMNSACTGTNSNSNLFCVTDLYILA